MKSESKFICIICCDLDFTTATAHDDRGKDPIMFHSLLSVLNITLILTFVTHAYENLKMNYGTSFNSIPDIIYH